MPCFAATSSKRGRDSIFSDIAIHFCWTFKNLYGLALRQTAGLVLSMLQLHGTDLVSARFQHALHSQVP